MDRVAHDNDAVSTVRATLARAGRTDRPRIEIDATDADAFPAGEVVRIALDGHTRHARVERGLEDGLVVDAVRDNARQAREGSARGHGGENRLPEWVADRDLDFGRSVLVDVVATDFYYGLRAPGETAVYEVPDRPDAGLASIARDLEGVE
jgi:hypothetical protein